MLTTITITAPVFLLIALGYGAVMTGGMPREAAGALGRFVVAFAIPALIFDAVASRPLAEVVNGRFLLVYGGGSLIAFTIGLLVSSWLRRRPLADNAFFGMGISMSNSALIGYPLILQLFGEEALVAIPLVMLVETLLMLPLTLVLAEIHRAGASGGVLASLRNIVRQLATNPILLAIVAGLCCAAFGIRLPTVVDSAVELLTGSAAGVALFTIGASLAGLRLRSAVSAAALIAAGKLLIHPLAVGLLLALALPFEPVLMQAALVLAALPMITIYPLLAQRYDHGDVAAAALLVTTAASFVTLTVGIWLLGITG